MTTLTAKEAKYGFGQLIDFAPAEPLIVGKHERLVIAEMAFGEFGPQTRLPPLRRCRTPEARPRGALLQCARAKLARDHPPGAGGAPARDVFEAAGG